MLKAIVRKFLFPTNKLINNNNNNEIWPYEQMVYAQPSICPVKWNAQIPLGFWDTNGSPNLGQMTRPSNNQQQKKRIVDFAVPADHCVKLKESEKKDKYFDLAREREKTVERENDDYTNDNWCSWYSYQRVDTGTEELGNKRMSGHHLNYSIIEIGQNIEKSLGDLRKLSVTRTPMKDHQLREMWKNSAGVT